MSAEPALATSLFADRLAEAVEHKRSQLIVGLDPRPDLLPVELVGDAQVDREEGGTEALAAASVRLHALFRASELGEARKTAAKPHG